MAVIAITPLKEAYCTRTFGSFETGDSVIPRIDPMLQVSRKREETMLRIDLGAFVYAYSIPVTKASNSESAVNT
jgi:hypothetical protein